MSVTLKKNSNKKKLNIKKIIIVNVILYVVYFITASLGEIQWFLVDDLYEGTYKSINYLFLTTTMTDIGTNNNFPFLIFIFPAVIYVILTVFFYKRKIEYKKMYILFLVSIIVTVIFQIYYINDVIEVLSKKSYEAIFLNDITLYHFANNQIAPYHVFILANIIFYIYLASISIREETK